MIAARADVIGSLLRPPELLQAQQDLAAGRISRARFKPIEDRAVDQCVKLQEEAGLEVVTDGEMRRLSFQSQLMQAVDGFGEWDIDAFLWGEWHGDEGEWTRERPQSLGAVSKLARKRHLSAEEFTYLRARTTRTPKVTLPSPSLFANFWSPALSRDAYPRLDDFLGDVTQLLRQEVEELVRLGCTYIQIDAPHYPLLIDPKTRGFYESQGWSVDEWLDLGITLDNQLMQGVGDDVTFAFHLCRGNQASRWLAEGGYDAIARPIFQLIAAERLMLEYDDARSGGFEPLSEVPDDKTVVLGLVTTKRPDLESVDDLAHRIEEASRHLPLDRLAISPQCGFSTSIVGNDLTIEDQCNKLKVLCETAQRVWG
ncbi:MAG: cobalamin-independent methionine synthase II family protein [Kiloniellales bacterium]